MGVKRTLTAYIAKCDATYCHATLEPFREKMNKDDFREFMESKGWWQQKRLIRTVCLCPECKQDLIEIKDRLKKIRDNLCGDK